METPLKIRLHVLSPIHIGCDEVYEPTSFLIDENRNILTEFDPIDFIKTLSKQEKERFTSLCMQGNISSIIGIYKFISGKSIGGREVEIVKELSQHYKRVRNFPVNDEKKIKQELNRFSIDRTAYSPYTSLPYIPGSSIKGSLRTAYLNALVRKDNIPPFKGKAGDLEKELMKGSFESDPFRMVKISDFQPVGNIKTKIYYAVNKKKSVSKYDARGPFQILEAVRGKSVFEGTISILDVPRGIELIERLVSAEGLYKSSHNFFNSIWNMDNYRFKKIGVNFSVYKNMHICFSEKLGKSVFLVRLGRHSGAESITIYGHRNIKIMRGRGNQDKYQDYTTTLWLASESSKPISNNGLAPFGWAALELEPFDNIPLEPVIAYQGKSKVNEFRTDRDIPTSQTFPDVTNDIAPASTPKEPEKILWKNITLGWNPGNNVISTTHEGKNAEVKGMDRTLVPETIKDKLFEKKRKKAVADIIVEHIGGKNFRIVAIQESQ